MKKILFLAVSLIMSIGAWAEGFPEAGKTYTIKATFAGGAGDSYLTNSSSTLSFSSTVVAEGSYWVAEATGNESYPWKFKSVAEPTKYLTGESAGVSETAMNFAVNACTSASGTYHLWANLSGKGDRNVGTWATTSGKSGFGHNGSGGCFGTGHNNQTWSTDYTIEEVVEPTATITAVFSNGDKYPLVSTGGKLTCSTATLPAEGIVNVFTVVNHVDNTIVLSDGEQFLHWTSGDDTSKSSDLDGLSTPQSEIHNLTLVPGTGEHVGQYLIQGAGTNGQKYYFCIRNNNNDTFSWVAGNPNDTFFDNNWNHDGQHRTSYFEVVINEPTFGPTEEQIAALKELYDEVFDLNGPIMTQQVGYPSIYSESVKALYDIEGINAENYETVKAALEALKVETVVNLPVAGKSYYIRPFYNKETSGYLYDNGTRLTSSTSLPESGAVFVVTHVNGNEMALKVAGTEKYLRWTQGSDGTGKSNPNTGYSAYDATYSTQTILKAVTTQEKGGPVNSVAGVTNADLYGLLEINGMGTDGKSYFLVNNAAGNFVAGNHDDKYYDNTADGRTVYYAFVEVTEGAAYELEIGSTGYSTLYLEKNVTIPEGVEVYYCEQDGEKLNAVALQTNDVIPNEVGVVVKGAANTTVAFPYTNEEYEGSNDPENSELMGVTVDTPVEEISSVYSNVYVLSVVDSQLGFYKFANTETLKACRAFLIPATGENVQGFVLNFGEQTTGIESLIQKSENGICFDLQGRRVNANVKGISIVNNKKVIK